jgi:hypothetical protein
MTTVSLFPISNDEQQHRGAKTQRCNSQFKVLNAPFRKPKNGEGGHNYQG